MLQNHSKIFGEKYFLEVFLSGLGVKSEELVEELTENFTRIKFCNFLNQKVSIDSSF